MASTPADAYTVDPQTGVVKVLLSDSNTLDECPEWWQNLIKAWNPSGHLGMRKLNNRLNKHYRARLVPGGVWTGSHLEVANLECYTQMVLEWS